MLSLRDLAFLISSLYEILIINIKRNEKEKGKKINVLKGLVKKS